MNNKTNSSEESHNIKSAALHSPHNEAMREQIQKISDSHSGAINEAQKKIVELQASIDLELTKISQDIKNSFDALPEKEVPELTIAKDFMAKIEAVEGLKEGIRIIVNNVSKTLFEKGGILKQEAGQDQKGEKAQEKVQKNLQLLNNATFSTELHALLEQYALLGKKAEAWIADVQEAKASSAISEKSRQEKIGNTFLELQQEQKKIAKVHFKLNETLDSLFRESQEQFLAAGKNQKISSPIRDLVRKLTTVQEIKEGIFALANDFMEHSSYRSGLLKDYDFESIMKTTEKLHQYAKDLDSAELTTCINHLLEQYTALNYASEMMFNEIARSEIR